MKVTRENIDKMPHLITDYMYENDNIGINLTLLNTMKTKKVLNVSGIPIDYNPISFNYSQIRDTITITTTMEFNATSEELNVIANVKYPNNTITYMNLLEDEEFATDIIDTCIVNKKDIKNMACYRRIFEETINTVKESALQEDVLIKSPELKYKCYVYSDNMELLGVANRLLENPSGYILGEYVGKKISEYKGKDIYIDLCINSDVTLQFSNVKVADCMESSLTYVLLETSSAMVKRLTENYNNIDMNVPKGFNFPTVNVNKNMNQYYEELLISNSPSNIEKFFKNNKPKMNSIIDINKYLIW